MFFIANWCTYLIDERQVTLREFMQMSATMCVAAAMKQREQANCKGKNL